MDRDDNRETTIMTAQARVWFITGASSGFGRALAEAVLARGECVALAARRRDALDAIAADHPKTALVVPLDVTDADARANAVASALNHFGRIDVLANIAGRGAVGAVEEFSADELDRIMNVNFVATVEITRLILPHMRAKGSGHILNLTSIGGIVSAGGFGIYCASKFAVEGWSEALRDELAPFGVRLTLIEPGNFRTEFAGDVNMRPAHRLGDYREQIEPVERFLEDQAGDQPGDPAKAAAAMIAVVDDTNPPLRLMLGPDAYEMWSAKLAAREAEFARWRSIGLATNFADANVRTIPIHT
jgi:NAD(P)-dependent dehydrogenase (short-subunit alcohol dehydrogenase family)